MNCHEPKDPSRYSEYLCAACDTASKEAEQYAAAENKDIGAERKKALASRAPSSMSHKYVNAPFDRVNSSAYEERLQKEANEPRSPIFIRK
jgi:hypothetical protein